MKSINTDLLVIGSGLAGLISAIECKVKDPDLKVTICSKSPIGLANCTAVSEGYFRSTSKSYSYENMKNDTLSSGYNLNDTKLLDVLITNIEKDLNSLKDYGVHLFKDKKRRFPETNKLNFAGTEITRPIKSYAKSLGVNFVNPYFAWEILHENNAVTGVWGFEGSENDLLIINAKGIIIATGGAGAIFSRTDNPPGMTGDGFAMAYRAGLPLINMEFVQFFPLGTAMAGKKNRLLPPILADAGKFFNVHNEDIVKKHNITKKPIGSASRDFLSRVMAIEVSKGNGVDGALKLTFNFDDYSWDVAKKLYDCKDIDKYKNLAKELMGNLGYIPVMPLSHFFCGGILIDSKCKTDLRGLFAAGEVTGCLHGANRLGGNALSEALVFGKVAGREAASYIEKNKRIIHGEDDEIKVLAKFESLFKSGNMNTNEIGKIKDKLRDLMWQNVGLIRDEKTLTIARSEIDTLDKTVVLNKSDSIKSFAELKNLMTVAKIIVSSSLIRKETRGSHYRQDYPEIEERWEKEILIGSK